MTTKRNREMANSYLGDESEWLEPEYHDTIRAASNAIAAAREEGRQEERERWLKWLEGPPTAG